MVSVSCTIKVNFSSKDLTGIIIHSATPQNKLPLLHHI